MDRRAAAAWVASTLLWGCGGGGDGVSAGSDTAAPQPAPAPAAPPAPVAAAPTTPNIAAWGDSLTPPFAVNLQILYPNRTIFDGGIGGQTSSQIAARETADTAGHNAWINTFWYGHNNDNEPDQIKADIAASVAALAAGNTRFIVLSLVNKAVPDESKGGAGYARIIQLNKDLQAAYPDHYLDVRAYLIAHPDPSNAQDLVDVQNDVVPSSMRYDEIHLRNRGSELAAMLVQGFIDSKGW
jgi:hypothetical protein